MRHETPIDGEILEPAERPSARGPGRSGADAAARGSAAGPAGGFAGSSLTQDEVELLRRADLASKWMDTRFRLPLTEWRFGLDGLLGLVPGIGDGAGLVVSGYVAWTAWHAGLPATLVAKMVGNIALDAVVGAVPVLGDLLDFGFKANRRNAELIRAHLERRTAGLA
ncbi:DUF4112 domain-containing protein [Albimonas pacifica]|uniref:DUF4112 domain-containing protein n=1 Tax=Albimonas pacifica TaxID=1114924 RepID=A0A1I3EJS2_9RHOB|nr:DUF4112 domain-containing protein [Albimonas pacifica]SFH99222.1 protein of unknown function [Albimonas pacifica]